MEGKQSGEQKRSWEWFQILSYLAFLHTEVEGRRVVRHLTWMNGFLTTFAVI